MSSDAPELPDDDLDQVDPIEDAWLGQEPEQVEKLARERLAAHPQDAASLSWLGLALWTTHKVPAGQAALKQAFELIRGQLAAAGDEEEKQGLTWELHGIASRLIDALSENPAVALTAAQFVIDTLKFEHAPGLRLLSEDVATRQGDPVKAAGLLKRALAVDSTDPESHYLAARLMARLGKKPQVLSHLQKALDHAAGTIAVRTLARFEPDFDGFRKDAEFNALIDLFPTDPVLRPLYVALDAGDFPAVAQLCAANAGKAKNALDLLYPWRESLELMLDQAEDGAPLLKELERVQAEIETHEGKDEESAVYQRFCGDA